MVAVPHHSTAMVAVPPGPAPEGNAPSPCPPCAFCQYHTAHVYFESMDPDTDTDSDFTDHDEEDEEFQTMLREYDAAEISTYAKLTSRQSVAGGNSPDVQQDAGDLSIGGNRKTAGFLIICAANVAHTMTSKP
eukprot:8258093-Prorocentrum_lima.AAC.1